MTRVSVGLPVFNADRYLEEALSTLLAQSHADLEIVVSDNASTDRTREICERFAAQDPRVRYLRQDVNRGASFNHNVVVTEARGEYFRWYAYDDRLDPHCIERCAAVLDADPTLVLAWPWTVVIDASGHESGRYRTDLPWDNSSAVTRVRSLLGHRTDESLLHMCYPVYGLVRREALLDTHLLGTNNGADTVLLVELALRGGWAQVPEWLFYNRRHADSSAVDKSPEEIAAWFDPSREQGTFPMPEARLFVGYLRAVLTADLSPGPRLRCLAIVGRWFLRDRRWRVILGELRIRGRQLVRPARRGPARRRRLPSTSAER